MIDQAIIDRSNASKRLENNADFIEICAAIEADLFASFRKVPFGDSEQLATVHALSHGFKLLKDRIAKYQQVAAFEAEIANNSEE